MIEMAGNPDSPRSFCALLRSNKRKMYIPALDADILGGSDAKEIHIRNAYSRDTVPTWSQTSPGRGVALQHQTMSESKRNLS